MPTILVIDDEPLMRRMVSRALTGAGHKVIAAEEGQEGLRLFRTHRPAVVITDLLMPGQEGIETILAMRRTGAPVRIIAISGRDAEMLETARLIGADDAIEKPFRAHELIEHVRALAETPPA